MLKSKKIVDWLYNYSLYFIIGALLLVIIAIEPSFVRVSNFTTILTQSATKIIYACGIAGIIVLGGTDLALGREVGLAAVVAASLLQAVDYSQRVFSADQVPALPLIVPLLLVMVLLGIICAAHGFIVAHWGVAPFVASLGVQLISYGLCLQYFNTVCNSNPLSGFTKTYSKFCQGTIRIGSISLSYLMFYAIAVVAVMWVIWNRTTLGKNMFAIGGNREAAKVCGVNVKRTIIIVYIIAGLLYAFGGVLEAGRTGSANSTMGADYAMDAIAACVVGGVSMKGGTGMTDCAGVAFHGVEMAGVTPGGTCVVIGPGPIGLCAMQECKALGAARVIVVGRGAKLEKARELGADVCIDFEKEDPVQRVLELTNGIGADEVMECSGAADSPMKACKMARKTGKVALIATYHAGDVMIPANTVNFNELTIVGSKANPNVSEQVLHFFSTGAIQGDKLVTHTFPLEDYEKAVDIFEHKKDGSIKVVINP